MGKSKKFSDREQTKKTIIEESAYLFNTKGYLSTSILDITNAVGLSKGSIYGNFDNKEAVALEVFRYNFQWIFSGINKKVTEATTAKDKLMAYVHYYRENYKAIFDRGGCALLNVSIDVDDDINSTLRAKAKKYIKTWEKSVYNLIDLGTQQNEWNQEVDKIAFFAHMVALIQGSIFLAKVTGEDDYILSNLDNLAALIEGISRD